MGVKFLIQNAKNTCANAAEISDKLSHRDRWGRTPLDDATTSENDSIVRALRKVHAKPGAGHELDFTSHVTLASDEANRLHLQRQLSSPMNSPMDKNNSSPIR